MFSKLHKYFIRMSYPYGPNSSRGSFSRRRPDDHFSRRGREGEHHENSHSGSSRGDSGQRGKPHGGRPPWLKGKEIGLYYRDRAKVKRKETRVIRLDRNVEQRIRSVLSECSFINNGGRDVTRKSQSSDLEEKYTHINESQFKRDFLDLVRGSIQENLAKAINDQSGLRRDTELDESLLRSHMEKKSSPTYVSMSKSRMKLPAWDKREEILRIVNENQVVVISGETGCGKTTQVAQFILDQQIEAGNGSITRVVCTQPRRISAISVADRVASERAERLGESVGFQIRLEKVLARDYGSILFCTTGMLLQFMQGDPALKRFSHVILDEIHERSTESDFIITLLKQVIPKRPDLKVILMSATLNSESFSKYYDDCPMIHIPGFTYPVEEFYLEDVLSFTGFKFPNVPEQPTNYRKHLKKYKDTPQKKDEYFIGPQAKQSEDLSLELIEKLVNYICSTKGPGAILIFLPGMMDIIKLHKMILESGRYPQSRYIIYPLHSRMPTADQKMIFREPPDGVRKIIISTSIAETSITIEDVVYVIDCGKTKLNRFDVNRNIQTLEPEWVTLANAKQRRGRAGRVQAGYCYHLYPKAKEATFDQYPLPEMLRTRLEEVILQIKVLQLGGAKQFLRSVMDPPDVKAVDLSLNLLRQLNALDSDEHLTPLGYHLAQLPLDPRTGKMIIWAALFSCIEPVFAIAASLSFKDAFYTPMGKEAEAMEKKQELSLYEYSDHIALAEALRRFETADRMGNANQFCWQYFLSKNTLKLLSDMKRQFAQHLCQMKFLENVNPSDRNANRNSKDIALIKAIVCAGLYPNIATVRHAFKRGVKAWTPEDGAVIVHPSSVNDRARTFPSPYLMYFTKQRSTAIYLHDTTCVTAPMLLFADPSRYIEREKGRCVISLNTSQKFVCDPQTADIIEKLQEQLTRLLEYKITHPGTVNWDAQEGRILNAIIELVSQKDEEMGFDDFHGENDDRSVADNK